MTHPTDDLTPDLFAPGEAGAAVQDKADLALHAAGDAAPSELAAADTAAPHMPAPGHAAPPAPPQAPSPFVWDGESPFPLHRYAEDAYLRYAMSVVRSRAIPDTADGMKPVQRRIIFAKKTRGNIKYKGKKKTGGGRGKTRKEGKGGKKQMEDKG